MGRYRQALAVRIETALSLISTPHRVRVVNSHDKFRDRFRGSFHGPGGFPGCCACDTKFLRNAQHQEMHMRMRTTFLLLAVSAVSLTAGAKDKEMSGTIVSENSVPCGSEAKSKKQTIQLMCQEYVLRTEATEYHVRQEKEAHKEMIPVNAPVEMTLNKDKMKFKVNGKSYEMLVVSESAAPAATAPAPAAAKP
jgi:hypothetical protein